MLTMLSMIDANKADEDSDIADSSVAPPSPQAEAGPPPASRSKPVWNLKPAFCILKYT